MDLYQMGPLMWLHPYKMFFASPNLLKCSKALQMSFKASRLHQKLQTPPYHFRSDLVTNLASPINNIANFHF